LLDGKFTRIPIKYQSILEKKNKPGLFSKKYRLDFSGKVRAYLNGNEKKNVFLTAIYPVYFRSVTKKIELREIFPSFFNRPPFFVIFSVPAKDLSPII